MKQLTISMLFLFGLGSLPGCLIAADNQVSEGNRFQIAAGGAGGPAAVFKMDRRTGQLWYAWWDPNEGRYQWREIDNDSKAQKPETTQPSK